MQCAACCNWYHQECWGNQITIDEDGVKPSERFIKDYLARKGNLRAQRSMRILSGTQKPGDELPFDWLDKKEDESMESEENSSSSNSSSEERE